MTRKDIKDIAIAAFASAAASFALWQTWRFMRNRQSSQSAQSTASQIAAYDTQAANVEATAVQNADFNSILSAFSNTANENPSTAATVAQETQAATTTGFSQVGGVI